MKYHHHSRFEGRGDLLAAAILFFLLALGAVLFLATPAHGQVVAPTPTPIFVPATADLALAPALVAPPVADNALLGLFLQLASTHPWIASVLSFMALCRVWAKPACSILHAVVDLTPSKTDDGLFNGVLGWFASPLGRKVAYLIDWLTSIKIQPPGVKAPAPLSGRSQVAP
ncbi:MAG: hypothetical protein H7067_08165 [Burkholderiales bacterium]|nr:hypothetical protein [Opitutaceae bacterium]